MDPVEEAKDVFWSLSMFTIFPVSTLFLARKAKSAGKSALKSFKKAVGIPTGPISETNPRYYMVIVADGALVRKEMDIGSPELYNLKFGDVVTCAEIIGRRARIIDPVEGWVSLVTSSNETLFELTFPPDKQTQVRTMERRFEKLKLEQASRRADESSPIATPVIQRLSDDDSSGGTAMRNLKSTKIVFKNPSTAGSVPALAPATRRPIVQDDLLLDDSSTQPSYASRVHTPELMEDPFSLL